MDKDMQTKVKYKYIIETNSCVIDCGKNGPDIYNEYTLTVSLVLVISTLPFHQVIVGAGRDPTTSHDSSYVLSADRGRFSVSSFTHKGRTGTIYSH